MSQHTVEKLNTQRQSIKSSSQKNFSIKHYQSTKRSSTPSQPNLNDIQIIPQQQSYELSQFTSNITSTKCLNNNNNVCENPNMADPKMIQPKKMVQIDPTADEEIQIHQSKLDSLNKLYVVEGQKTGCSPIKWCDIQTATWNIHDKKQHQNKILMQINLDQPTLCFKDKIKGQFEDFEYESQNHQNNLNSETLYEIENDRNCCFFKCIFSWMYLLGALMFSLLTYLCPPTTRLKKNGQLIAKYKYENCRNRNLIYDDQDNLQYKISTIRSQKIVTKYYQQGERKLRTQIKIEDKGTQREMDIAFNENLSQDDKAIILVGLTNCN